MPRAAFFGHGDRGCAAAGVNAAEGGSRRGTNTECEDESASHVRGKVVASSSDPVGHVKRIQDVRIGSGKDVVGCWMFVGGS